MTDPDAREAELLVAVQRASTPTVDRCAVLLSHAGEHAATWLVVAGVGAVIDRPRRQAWFAAGCAVFGSHAASVALKRVVRRHRPTDPRLRVGVSTPSRWSFPSSHATSTTAAAVTFADLTGSPAPLGLIPAMAAGRLVLGVHYPSDVVAGSVLGVAAAVAVRRWTRPTR